MSVPWASSFPIGMLTLLAMAACSANVTGLGPGAPSGPDGGPLPDTMDAGTVDATTLPDAAPLPDAGDVDPEALFPCLPETIVDLDALGTSTGSVTRYVGSNEAAAVEGDVWVRSNPESVFAPVSHRYTPRMDTRLVVSLDNPKTPSDFVGRVWVLSECTHEPTTQLFDSRPPSGTPASASLPVSAGVPVFIIVSGHVRRLTGPYELSVRELEVVRSGASCSDPTWRTTNHCEPGTTCVETESPDVFGTCEPEGAAGRQCRTTGPACDKGLACNQYPPAFGSLCATAVAVGERCSQGHCVEGSYCAQGVCAAFGSADNQCRSEAPVCDAGLLCSGSFCRPAVDLGEDCLPTGWGPKCVASLTCVDRRCVEDGSLGASCRDGPIPCDEGLGCRPAATRFDRSFCLPPTVLAGDCAANSCPPASQCKSFPGGPNQSPELRCIADGAEDGTCRAGANPCEVGLSCIIQPFEGLPNHETCQPFQEGDPCMNPAGPPLGCPRGSVCTKPAEAESTCVAPTGSAGEPCRLSGRACDPGLFCEQPQEYWYTPLCRSG